MPYNVFISYAHKDRRFRDEMAAHLSNLRNQNLINDWFDGDIIAGTEWEQQILEHLQTSQIILLLISVDFLASKFCYSTELKLAIARHDANQARVIPIILRPVDWKDAPFAKLLPLPTDGKPVSKWPTHDDAFANVAKGIRRVIEDWKGGSSQSPPVEPLQVAGTKSMGREQGPIWNIPFRRNPFFTGRESTFRLINKMLHLEHGSALSQPLAITGLGGIGKTQIAVEYSYRYQDEYHFVLWVQANTHEILTSGFLAIAVLLNLPVKDAQDQGMVVQAVKHWLEEHDKWLLIFDNVDDLSLIDVFLPIRHTGHILFTTRSHIMSGRAHRVEVEEMNTEEGTLFLLRRAGLIAPNISLTSVTEAVHTSAITIVRYLDGFPLALDQAGAYIEEIGCDLSRYLDLYQTRRKELHARRSKRLTDHPEPITSTLSLSFQNVERANPAAAELLRFFAFLHPDTIPEEIITEGALDANSILQLVASDPIKFDEAIVELLNYSLVRRHPETRSLSMHRLVQAVLQDEMDQTSQKYWAEQAIRAINHLFPLSETTTWPLCQRYLPHAMLCEGYIKHWDIASVTAAELLYYTASYLQDRAQYREAEPLYQHSLEIFKQVQGHDHPDTALAINSLANLYREQGKLEQVEPLYQRALAIYEQAFGIDHPDTADSLNNLGLLYHDQGKYEQAESLYQRALAIYEQALGIDHPDTADSLNNLGLLYYDQGKYEQAEPLYLRALAIRERTLGTDHPTTAMTLNNLANLYIDQDKYEQAEPLFQRSLMIMEKVQGHDHPDTAMVLNNFANLYREQGKLEQAEPLYLRALAIYEQVLGDHHLSTAMTLNNLALIYHSQYKYEQAESLYQRTLVIRERVLGIDHLDTMHSLNKLAKLYHDQGKYEQAEPLYRRSLATYERVLGVDHPDTAGSLNNLGLLYHDQGKYEQAELLYQQALAIREQVLGAHHPDTADSLDNLGLLYHDQGKLEQAEPLYQQALAIYEAMLGPDHPDTVQSLNNLAFLYDSQGKYEQAEPLYQRALAIREKRLGPEHPDTTTVRVNYTNLLQKIKDKQEQQS